MLDAAQRPIWLRIHMSELEAAVRLTSIKSDYNVSHDCFNEIAGIRKEACPPRNALPSEFSEVKKNVGKLGLTVEKLIVVLMTACCTIRMIWVFVSASYVTIQDTKRRGQRR